jgi:hypothetical protein
MLESTPLKVPFFKKIDLLVFEKVNKFKQSLGHQNLQDFYNSLEEDQQKIFKAGIILIIFLIPTLFIGILWWQNSRLKTEMGNRINIISKSQEIIGERQSLRNISPRIISDSPIDGDSMMTSRLSNLLSSVSVDLSKIQISNYFGELVTTSIQKAQADFQFSNLSTDELVNIFTNMMTREKFRIDSLDIKRNPQTNLLQGSFHAIHLGNAQNLEDLE